MSRVGKRIIQIPSGTEVKIDGSFFEVKGKLGSLSRLFSPFVNIKHENNQISVERLNELKPTKQLHGTTNALIANMVKGVSEGFKKELKIEGVGYKATLKGQNLELAAGYSHPVSLVIPKDLKVEVPKPVNIIISGIDKQVVGEFAAKVRGVRPPSVYSGKGIQYKDESGCLGSGSRRRT